MYRFLQPFLIKSVQASFQSVMFRSKIVFFSCLPVLAFILHGQAYSPSVPRMVAKKTMVKPAAKSSMMVHTANSVASNSRPTKQVIAQRLHSVSQVTLPKKGKDPMMSLSVDAATIAISKKRWGIDNAYKEEYWEREYWFDARIHSLGNRGFLGACHAAVAALSTKIIDITAYEGVPIRHKLARSLSQGFKKGNIRVVDLCCGVGISTRALREAFPNAEMLVGVDTSPEMVAMANFLTKHTDQLSWAKPLTSQFSSVGISTGMTLLKEQRKRMLKAIQFLRRNAEETTLPSNSFDLVTVMYALHEAPKKGREKIVKEAKRLLVPGGTLAIVDISTDYKPSEMMLQGEPYVTEYQKSIQKELLTAPGFRLYRYTNEVPGRVGMWVLKRT